MTDTNNCNLTHNEKQSLIVISKMGEHCLKCLECSAKFVDILNHASIPIPKFELTNTSEET